MYGGRACSRLSDMEVSGQLVDADLSATNLRRDHHVHLERCTRIYEYSFLVIRPVSPGPHKYSAPVIGRSSTTFSCQLVSRFVLCKVT